MFYRSGEKQTTILKFEIRKLETNTKSWTQIFPAQQSRNQKVFKLQPNQLD